MGLKKDNDVGMRKTPLLEFNGVEVASHITQYAFPEVFDERLELGMKDAHHQVRAIRSCLTLKEGICDFWPGRVGSNGNKKVSSSKVVVDGQGILTLLIRKTSFFLILLYFALF